MHAEPSEQHRWLDRLVGEWTCESECSMGPGQPPSSFKGTEVVRSIGGLWVVAEGTAEMPDGGTSKTMMTIGYDSSRGAYVGTFVASMMTYLWIYRGAVEADGRRLVLEAEGPNFTGVGTANYKDIIEFVGDDHRVMTSEVQGDDGTWSRIMTMQFKRKR